MTTPGAGDQSLASDIEQLSVPQQPLTFPATSPSAAPAAAPATMQQPASPLYPDLISDMNRYLDKEALHKLAELEQGLHIPLDAHHRQLIIEDIRKQIPARLHFYVKQAENNVEHKAGNMDRGASAYANVLSRTQRDTDAALLAYIKHLQGNARAGGN
jgi:spore germination protein PC